jgi:tRNA pseudouridine55 synthase
LKATEKIDPFVVQSSTKVSRSRKGRHVHGILLLDKPAGISSNQALQKVRRLFNARKGGHTGNLDPFATGMLPICLGEASKTAGYMLQAGKAYRAVARLGQATRTGDIEGEVTLELSVPTLLAQDIETAFKTFLGAIEQVPPMYSALKHEGQPLYKLARLGQEVERNPRKVLIHHLELLSWDNPDLEFEVHCSKGTYIRTLAEDMGDYLGTCAHLQSLRRLWVEPFTVQTMVSMEDLEQADCREAIEGFLLPLDAALESWPKIELAAQAEERFLHGNPVPIEVSVTGMTRVYGSGGRILGLGELVADGRVHPRRLFLLG